MRANVYRIGGDTLTGPTLGYDPIYFTKDQIRPGVELLNFGRRQYKVYGAPTKWAVKRLIHYYYVKPNHSNRYQGAVKYHRLDKPKTYESVAILVSEKGSQMELTIGYMAGSALWRLAA